MAATRACAYTVFRPDGSIRPTVLGLPAFVRTLRAARSHALPGDTIQAWSSCGNPLKRYRVKGQA